MKKQRFYAEHDYNKIQIMNEIAQCTFIHKMKEAPVYHIGDSATVYRWNTLRYKFEEMLKSKHINWLDDMKTELFTADKVKNGSLILKNSKDEKLALVVDFSKFDWMTAVEKDVHFYEYDEYLSFGFTDGKVICRILALYGNCGFAYFIQAYKIFEGSYDVEMLPYKER